MALEPCKVCGSLNSSEAEICLSCGYPTKGKRRPAIFQWAAIGLVLVFVIPLLLGLINLLKLKLEPKPLPSKPQVSMTEQNLQNLPSAVTVIL